MYWVRMATDDQIHKMRPRKLFEVAMKSKSDSKYIQSLKYGITDLYIGEKGENFIQITAIVRKTPENVTKFDVKKLERKDKHAIYFYLGTKQNKHFPRGLFEVDHVGFMGIDDWQSDRFLLFPEHFLPGTANLIERLLNIFPGFLNRVYIDISQRRYIGIFEHLGQVEKFLGLCELSVLKYMDGAMWSSLVENLDSVKKVTMGRESNFGDIEGNHSVTHLIVENGSSLDDFTAMDYEILEIKDYPVFVDDIKELIDLWKDGQKPNLKFLNMTFKKELRIDELMQLKRYLGGRRRSLRRGKRCEKMEFRVDNRIFSLKDAMDVKIALGCSGSYILTKKSFQFFPWESPKKKEIVEMEGMNDDTDDSSDDLDLEDST